MSIQEQQETKEMYYSEAMRYMDNAKECLKKTEIDINTRLYKDRKYVRMACGTAYSGVLIALDCFLILKGIHAPNKKVRKSIEYYQNNIGKQDKKMLDILNEVYQILHLSGYYDGTKSVNVVKEGFNFAKIIIDKIKPEELSGAM